MGGQRHTLVSNCQFWEVRIAMDDCVYSFPGLADSAQIYVSKAATVNYTDDA